MHVRGGFFQGYHHLITAHMPSLCESAREVCHQKQPFLLGLWVEKLEQEMETCERKNHVTQPCILLLCCGWESVTTPGAALPAELGLCPMIPLWV